MIPSIRILMTYLIAYYVSDEPSSSRHNVSLGKIVRNIESVVMTFGSDGHDTLRLNYITSCLFSLKEFFGLNPICQIKQLSPFVF